MMINMIRETIIEILNDIDDEIVEYDGENLLEDGVVDSFTIMEIIGEISDRLGIDINPDDIIEEHFKTIDAIVEFVESLK